ncbi:Bre2 protein [Maudiozyma humilis]|uniref:Bre2 protein n=1 Tax=Maudiozyma humilis TaxID=51915 RepID=A0AAV5RUV1_MAUHU|nr:Bre2 protein [Kazachstania humilis]
MKIGIIAHQKDDFIVKEGSDRPAFPEFQSTYDGYSKPHDTPLNKRNFVYTPCAPIKEFTQLGYCNTEYPYPGAGFNTMDRSDGLSMKNGTNDTVGVMDTMGWRSGRSDVCIKEGTSYWEIEVVKGGSTPQQDEGEDTLKGKESIDHSPHLRFGVTRREAGLEAPVGFDSYGYGIRDEALESVHEGKLVKQLNSNGMKLKVGDRIGLMLTLPTREEQINQAKEYAARRLEALELADNNSSSADSAAGRSDSTSSNGGPMRKRPKVWKPSPKGFERALLQEIDYDDVIRDQIAIRYKGQLFFESSDYVKTTKPEYYSSDRRERQDYYTLKESSLNVFLNGVYLGKAFENISPFLPPFSEVQYNEKFYYNHWKNGELKPGNSNTEVGNENPLNSKDAFHTVLRNKYVNNNRLGYYPTMSCFNGGEGRLITAKGELKHLEQAEAHASNSTVKTLEELFAEQVSDDLVWDLIDEIEEEMGTAAKKTV